VPAVPLKSRARGLARPVTSSFRPSYHRPILTPALSGYNSLVMVTATRAGASIIGIT